MSANRQKHYVAERRESGNKQSGGKRLSCKTTKGNPYLRAILFEVAWAIAHTKDNDLSAFYHRMARRHGKKKAMMALARHPS